MGQIVVVDDQGTSRKVLSALVANVDPDAKIMAFSDPLAALAYMHEQVPDLLVTDYKMPEIDGAELIRRFRNVPDCENVPVVIVTAFENPEHRNLAFDAGANEFIVLPFDHHDFCARSVELLLQYRKSLAKTGRYPSALPQIAMFNLLLESASARLLHKVRDLDTLERDFDSLLKISAVAAVFLDENLRIRRFTPLLANFFAISASDIGRSLLELICYLHYPELHADFRRAIDGDNLIERRLQRHDGAQGYSVRMLPTRSAKASVPGVTIEFSEANGGPGGRSASYKGYRIPLFRRRRPVLH